MRTHIDPDDGPIAQIAIDHDLELLHDDRAFDALAQDRLTL
jgi:predicted nucleic acid-binding protein